MENKQKLLLIDEAAANASDPERAKRNLLRYLDSIENADSSLKFLDDISRLFGASQFLANFCIARPGELSAALQDYQETNSRELYINKAETELIHTQDLSEESVIKSLRHFKFRHLLRITLRDLKAINDIRASMYDLTCLAEIIIQKALHFALFLTEKKYGPPQDSTLSLIALGKLGGEELNYSSDVDLIAVYSSEAGQTAGIPSPSGLTFNRISNHEYYCRTIELFSRLLSRQTEDGIAYRVDLRLRPQGQKGDIALPLAAYKTYYESWGRTWERMAMIRARPIAGDEVLGKLFLRTIDPFIWRSSLDYAEVDEIKMLKKKIDSNFNKDDLKRGYGGIREAEFFIQTFQLLFGGQHSSLQTHRMRTAIDAIKQLKFVPEQELEGLWDNYLFLRKAEHYIQMLEDRQTHTLPASVTELAALALKTGFALTDEFLSELRKRRMLIKGMYNSLLGSSEDVHSEALSLIEDNAGEKELAAYFAIRKVKHPAECVKNLMNLRQHIRTFRTVQERRIMREVIPQMLEGALSSEVPDRSIAGLEKLFSAYHIKSLHLTAFQEQKDLMLGILKIFSLSPYLTHIFLSNQLYLDTLIEEWSILKTLTDIKARVERAINRAKNIGQFLAEFRRMEEIRLGMLYLQGILQTNDLYRGISHLADAIIGAITERLVSKDLAIIALGKLGGREMNFGSDLDIIFVSASEEAMSAAERILTTLTSYTESGILYEVDTRLRPDGARGILVNDIEGFRNYYLNSAQNWEIQALLRARPVAGDHKLTLSFIEMAKTVVQERGDSVKQEDISSMRKRIVEELSMESKGIDIKLGPGGIEEIEFFIQYLQLQHARAHPDILVQNMHSAFHRLEKSRLLDKEDAETLRYAYKYFRKIETILRLNALSFIADDSDIPDILAKVMGMKDRAAIMEKLLQLRKNVLAITNR